MIRAVIILSTVIVGILSLSRLTIQSNQEYSSTANEFFIAFPKNAYSSETLRLFITSPSPDYVWFSVNTPAGYVSYTRRVRNASVSELAPPESLELQDNRDRNKGIWIKALNNKKVAVFVLKSGTRVSGGFLALPCHVYSHLEQYTYYAFSYLWGNRTNYGSKGGVLLVGSSNNTQISITPSQRMDIPSDLRSSVDSRWFVSAGETYTITLHRLQTFNFESVGDLTGTKVVSDKPISLISYHECVDVPLGVAFCDYIVEQLPPTVTWGRFFLVASLHTRMAGERYRVTGMRDSTSILIHCHLPSSSLPSVHSRTLTLHQAGQMQEFSVDANQFCSIQSDKPILLIQYSTGYSLDRIGDPFMLNVPPVEQYSNNFTIRVYQNFNNHLTVTVDVSHFNPSHIYISGYSFPRSSWSPIYCSTSTICGYGIRYRVQAGTHYVYHADSNAKLNVLAYGFEFHTAYGNAVGMELNWIADVCIHGDIRLVQGQQPTPGVGQVELCVHGAWSSVCSNQWTSFDAGVVCRQLGYSPIGAVAQTGLPVNNNTVLWPFIFTSIQCNGSESRLIDCPHSTHITQCSLTETVHVHCQSFHSPSVRLTVSTPLHIHSSVTLSCVATVNAAIFDEVNIRISWTMGHTPLQNSSQMSISPTTTQTSQSSYRSELTIHTMENSHNGIYTCTAVLVSSTHGVLLSTPSVGAIYLSVGASSNQLFQLKLNGVGHCSQWLLRFSTPSEKVQQVSTSVVNNILPLCNNNCELSTNHITDGAFQCFTSDSHDVTFRARLHATPQMNTTDLINLMLQWIGNGATINVGGVLLNVEADCDLIIRSFGDPECESDEDDPVTTATQPSTTMLTTTQALPRVTLLQLKLIGVGQCSAWLLQQSSFLDKIEQVSSTIVSNVLELCDNCELSTEHFTDGAFQCFRPDSHNITFRAELYTTYNEEIIRHITSWVQNGATITISGLLLRVDSACNVIITSYNEPECNEVQYSTTAVQTTQIYTTPPSTDKTTTQWITINSATTQEKVSTTMKQQTSAPSIASSEADDPHVSEKHFDIIPIIIGIVVVVVIFILAVVFTILAVSCLCIKYRKHSAGTSTNPISVVSPFPAPIYTETQLDMYNSEAAEKCRPPDYDYSSSKDLDDPPLYWKSSTNN